MTTSFGNFTLLRDRSVIGSKLFQGPVPALSLVIGGARSGKSRLAEALVKDSARPRVYIATAQAWDDEMRAKIAAHQQDRDADWQTIEAPLDVAAVLTKVTPDQVILLDCATLWLSNHLLANHDLGAQVVALRKALKICVAPVVVVSNEVGWSIVPDNALARQFQNAQGLLNQDLAQDADLVLAVMAGLPLMLKVPMA
jgi:adenosylcobinamide kinase/adenosylcobinamide-phosphate guanylyltransferase